MRREILRHEKELTLKIAFCNLTRYNIKRVLILNLRVKSKLRHFVNILKGEAILSNTLKYIS
jgi:hypothetical protein